MRTAEIRQRWLDFFEARGHTVVPSAPLISPDPSTLFVIAGMVPFIPYMLGEQTAPWPRATSVQKCVRTLDIEEVGKTTRHGTFFQMNGNFSFGDYFKEGAITHAWELITTPQDQGGYGFDPEKIWVTVYETDDEAAELWKKIAGLPDSRIIRIATSDNFWAMGDTGPCGPCSEIFIDQGDKLQGGPPASPDEDGDRFLEFWNLVFMQYEQITPEQRVDLPRPSIDTGMGLERISAILQGVYSNYDTDLFRNLIRASEEATGVKAEGANRAAHRVIADHLRASSFLVADGVLPSNEGRGYVLRRIMRRAMRYAELLGAKDPLMFRLVPALVREMGAAYPELVRAESLITETLKLEETRFRKTLERGLAMLEDEAKSLQKGDSLKGETAFTLYDTYGFPLDLTQDALKPRGIAVDTKGFEAAMEKQKAKARESWKGSGDAATEIIWFGLKEKLGATEFLGYETESAEGVVSAIVKDGAEVKSLKAGEEGAVVLNQTPFYGESGGQVGDTGILIGEKVKFRVTDTQKKAGDLFVHFGKVEEGTLEAGNALELKVDHARRSDIRRNHSATHLLHEALRQVLGDHVAQKGSLVAPDRLRFDFSHPKPITQEEIAKIEAMANDYVLQNSPVTTRIMALDDARAAGARALFGEKYSDEVRVVAMGDTAGGNALGWSVELCGGTHVGRTGDIGLVAVTGESGVAGGVRRIEAATGEGARRLLREESRVLDEVTALLKSSIAETPGRLAALLDERKKLERELTDAKKKLAMGGGSKAGADDAVRSVGDVKLFARAVEGIEIRDLKSLVDEGKKQVGSGVVAIVGVTGDGKAGIVVGVTPDLTSKFSAVDLVRKGAEALGGKGGGGRPDMAQAGGPDGARAGDALKAIEAALGS